MTRLPDPADVLAGTSPSRRRPGRVALDVVSRGRHRRRRQIPLLVGGLGFMTAGAVVAVLLIGAPGPTVMLLVLMGLGAWLVVRRRARGIPG